MRAAGWAANDGVPSHDRARPKSASASGRPRDRFRRCGAGSMGMVAHRGLGLEAWFGRSIPHSRE